MSQWIERINAHPIWDELKSLGLIIDRAVAREGHDADILDGLERIRSVLTFCGKRLAATDPVLIDPRSLTELNRHLAVAKSEIEAFVTDGSTSHITAANASADEILVALPSILAALTTDDLTSINESISSYRTTLEKHLATALAAQQSLKEASDSNETAIAALAIALTTEQQRLASLVLDYQTQFSTAQDTRASEFSAALAEQNTKFAASSAEQQTQFSKDQDERNSGYVESQIANQEKFAALITDYTQKLKDQEKDLAEKSEIAAKVHEANLKSLKSDYEASAENVLDQINIHKKEVENLVGVIGNLGVTSGYQKVANLARTMLFVWQAITVIALAGLVFVAYQMAFPSSIKAMSVAIEIPKTTLSILPSSKPQLSEKTVPSTAPTATIQATPTSVSDSAFYQGLATRIFLSLTFGVFAAYAAKQASHFLEMERKNRKLALELEALGPYIAPLDKIKQDEFRIKIGDRSFGMQYNDSTTQKSDDPVAMYDILNADDLGKFAATLVKGLK